MASGETKRLRAIMVPQLAATARTLQETADHRRAKCFDPICEFRDPRALALIAYEWRGHFRNEEVNALHAEGFGDGALGTDWWSQVNRHGLGWVCARAETELVGFVHVAWDGGAHAFILSTVVRARLQHNGIGTSLVRLATNEARAAGCQWLHVDFEEKFSAFYFAACGFRATAAGLIRL